MYANSSLRLLLKRGAIVTAANWPVVLVQFAAGTTFRALLAVPIVGSAVVVALTLGTDLGDLLQGSLRDIVSTLAGALTAEPVALWSFVCALGVVVAGGSVLMFLVKGGTVSVLAAGNRTAGPVERPPLRLDGLRQAEQFSLARFSRGCGHLFRRYLKLGLLLIVVYGLSAGLYVALVVYGYRMIGDGALFVGWTLLAALAATVLAFWITVVNLLYLLLQVAIAVDDCDLREATASVARFIRADFRELARVFTVVVTVVILATLASALAWSGVGLIAFVPLVGLAVLPLQVAAFVLRGVVFEYLGLMALGAYLTLYQDYSARRRAQDSASRLASSELDPSPFGRMRSSA